MREKYQLAASSLCPNQGSNPQPFWCTGWCSSQLSHPSRARHALLKRVRKTSSAQTLGTLGCMSKRSLQNSSFCISQLDLHVPGGAGLDSGEDLQTILESKSYVPSYIAFHSLRLLNFWQVQNFTTVVNSFHYVPVYWELYFVWNILDMFSENLIYPQSLSHWSKTSST